MFFQFKKYCVYALIVKPNIIFKIFIGDKYLIDL